MLARRLMPGRRQRRVEDEPVVPEFPVAQLTHIVNDISPASSSGSPMAAYPFTRVTAAPGRPAAVSLVTAPDTSLSPAPQFVGGSHTHGTITLSGKTQASAPEGIFPEFGRDNVVRAGIFRCSAAGIADEAPELLPFAPLTVSCHLCRDFAVAVARTGSPLAHDVKDLRTGTIYRHSLPAGRLENLGTAVIRVPTGVMSGTDLSGLQFVTAFSGSGPPGQYMTETTALDGTPWASFDVIRSADLTTSHAFDLRPGGSSASDLAYSRTAMRTVTPERSGHSTRGGAHYTLAQLFTWRLYRGDLGPAETLSITTYDVKRYPCTIRVVGLAEYGLLRYGADGTVTFMRSSRRDEYDQEFSVFYYAGERTRRSDGVAMNLDVARYYKADGTAWRATDGSAGADYFPLANTNPAPWPSIFSGTRIYALPDRLLCTNSLTGGFQLTSIAYDGSVLSDGIGPSGSIYVIPGESVLVALVGGDYQYSTDYGATWIEIDVTPPIPNGIPAGNRLQTVKLF